jgi:P4 family phage/plasmid primase-like protien
MNFNRQEIEYHCQLFCHLAYKADPNGYLAVQVYGAQTTVWSYRPSQWKAMVDQIMTYGGVPGVNIGMPPVTFQGVGDRTKSTVRKVFGLFTEADDPETKPARPPNYIVESSPGHFHHVHFFDQPLSQEEAQKLADAMKRVTKAQGQGNTVNCIRIPGTCNSKYESLSLVRVHQPWDQKTTTPAEMHEAIGPAPEAPRVAAFRYDSAAAPKPANSEPPPSVEDMIAYCVKVRDAGPGEWVNNVWTLDPHAYDGDPQDTAEMLARKRQFGYFGRLDPYWRSIHAIRRAYGDSPDAVRIIDIFKDSRPDKYDDNMCQTLADIDNPPTIGAIIRASNDLDRAESRDRAKEVLQEAVAQLQTAPPLAPDGTVTKVLPAQTIVTPDGQVVDVPEQTVTYHSMLPPKGGAVPGPGGVPDFDIPEAEDTLALHFINAAGYSLRHVPLWGKWYIWNGRQWAKDEVTSVFDLIRKHVRQHAKMARDQAKMASAQKIAAVERLARTDQRVAVTHDVWDANPWILNTPGGIVDLRTGKLFAAAPEAHCTKITAVAPFGDCPIFKAFLHTVTGGNADLIAYIRRILGYCLTGVVSEEELYFLYGLGANGKSVLLNIVRFILHDYATVAPMDALMDRQNEEHKTELADLMGARAVIASETEEGRHWAEAKVKRLTGSDPIKARFMRQDFFEFMPQFKLLIAGNHQPRLRTVDEAIKRRIRMLPFTVTIPEAERDKGLTDKLKAEAGGILSWCVEGCMEWQRVGMQVPTIVTAMTEEYLHTQDSVANWIEAKCSLVRDAQTPRDSLYQSYSAWADWSRERRMSNREFYAAMERKFAPYRLKTGERGFVGIIVNLPAPPPMPQR